MGYLDLIKRYDRPHTHFYQDPPYYGCEKDYGRGIFSRTDFDVLAKALSTIKGKFCLSINDRPETRRAFAGFNIRQVSTRYSSGQPRQKDVRELLIMNFRPN